jgi:hypothetical protein
MVYEYKKLGKGAKKRRKVRTTQEQEKNVCTMNTKKICKQFKENESLTYTLLTKRTLQVSVLYIIVIYIMGV